MEFVFQRRIALALQKNVGISEQSPGVTPWIDGREDIENTVGRSF